MRMLAIALFLMVGCGEFDDVGSLEESVVQPGEHDNGKHNGNAWAWGHYKDRGREPVVVVEPEPAPSYVCGDGVCVVEELHLCALDCGTDSGTEGTDDSQAVLCGDGACVFGEQCDACLSDCGPCPVCGDGMCQISSTAPYNIPHEPETASNCPQDCS